MIDGLARAIWNFQGDNWEFHLPHLIVAIMAVGCGVITAIANYFWIHSDTDMDRSQMWEHIWGLFAFFVFGSCLGGVITWVALWVIGAFG